MAISSWLSGGEAGDTSPDSRYPGDSLGLPETGSGALARMGRRFAALLLDWFIAVGLTAFLPALGLVHQEFLRTSVGQTAVLAVWVTLGAVSVRLFGFTPGQLALGMQVVPVDGRLHVGFGRAVSRGLLLALVIPALFMDGDGRGLQDRFTHTALVRR